MGHIEGVDRNQLVLFLEALDEYISADNPIRFVDAFVDSLDLAALGFQHAVPNDTGRPPYHPGDLLKLLIYGYLNHLRSSRLLEKEAGRNVELMWLLRKLTPDFKTIADFRKDNRQAIRNVCRVFTLYCREMGLFGGELLAIDGQFAVPTSILGFLLIRRLANRAVDVHTVAEQTWLSAVLCRCYQLLDGRAKLSEMLKSFWRPTPILFSAAMVKST